MGARCLPVEQTEKFIDVQKPIKIRINNHQSVKYSRYDPKTISLIISFWNHRYNSTPSHLCKGIQSLIQLFAQSEDTFDQSVAINQCVTISNGGLTAEKTTAYIPSDWQTGYGLAFGSHIVEQDQCMTWKLQITQTENPRELAPCIGIVAVDEMYKLSNNVKENSSVYEPNNLYGLDGYEYIGFTRGDKYCKKLRRAN